MTDPAAVADRARGRSPSCGHTAVVAIDGRAGSGKSTLAADLAARLGCPVVALECLYPGWDGLAAGVDLLVSEVLGPLSRGEAAQVPAYDWLRDGWGAPWTLEPPALLVVEGVGAATRPVRPHLALTVWLECDADVRRERALGRALDGAAFADHWEQWAEQEHELFDHDPVTGLADLVIRTDG